MSKATILFAGGGSGGHISPLIAVMEQVSQQAPEVACVYVGLPADLESPLLDASDLKFERYAITAGKLHRHLTVDQFRQTVRVAMGMVQAESLLARLKPSVVFCKGSMVSLPIARAAARRGIPVYSHETDVVPGLANRLISRYAKGIFTAFPASSYSSLPIEKLIPTGQPVRGSFYKPMKAGPLALGGKKMGDSRPLLVVVGGSQGAHRLNEMVSEIWPELLREFELVHICGPRDLPELTRAAGQLAPELAAHLNLMDHVNEGMPELFAKATVVISRAGGTIFELAACKSPTILVPLSTAAQDHQRANAKVLSAAHAALVVDETVATASQELLTLVNKLKSNDAERAQLSEGIGSFARPKAAAEMATHLLKGLEPEAKIR